jgi:murein DD-endopeptidase MepM/ murein hydrolase activator NlpD
MQIYLEKYLGVFFVFFILTGCVIHPGASSALEKKKPDFFGPSAQGVFHTVQVGQTLWRIAQVYKVPIRKIRADNHLKSDNGIYAGQKIWISGARKVLPVPATCPLPAPAFSSPSSLSPSAPASPLSFSWPLRGKVIRTFGQDGLQRSEGIDIQAPSGTLVKAAAPGKVIYASSDLLGYGKIIIIQHRGGYSTVYTHIQENLVKVNSTVSSGEAIARIGQSGDDAIASLHFEIRYRQKAFDPISYLP